MESHHADPGAPLPSRPVSPDRTTTAGVLPSTRRTSMLSTLLWKLPRVRTLLNILVALNTLTACILLILGTPQQQILGVLLLVATPLFAALIIRFCPPDQF
jgi:hypothetical protein